MSTETGAHPEAGGNTALLEGARWHYGIFWLPNLDKGKGNQKRQGKHKQCYNTPLTPLYAVSYWVAAGSHDEQKGPSSQRM